MVLIKGIQLKGIPFFPIVPPPHTLFHCPLFHWSLFHCSIVIVPLFHCHCPLCKHQTGIWECSKNGPNLTCFVHFDLKCALRHSAVQFCNIWNRKTCFCHHSSMQFLISAFTTWLRTHRFNKPTFGLTRHTNHWKNTAIRNLSNNMESWKADEMK